MADIEEPQFVSLSQRIAALNQSQASRPFNGPTGPIKKAPPPTPGRPQIEFRSKIINNMPTSNFAAGKQYSNEPSGPKNLAIHPPPPVDRDSPQVPVRPLRVQKSTAATVPPPLPRRESTLPPSKPSPALPPRKSSGQAVIRKKSNESTLSYNSTISTFSIGTSGASSTSSAESIITERKTSPYLEQSRLPPLLPPRREMDGNVKAEKLEKDSRVVLENEPRRAMLSTKSAPVVPQISRSPLLLPAQSRMHTIPIRERSPDPKSQPKAAMPALPPRLPPRSSTTNIPVVEEVISPRPRRLPPVTAPVISKKTTRINDDEPGDIPPPVPLASRPTAAQIHASKSAPVPNAMSSLYAPLVGGTPCWTCRDFSGPDNLAAQYPRHTIPDNSTEYLASVLCGPFDSATDKARAIFSWMHHNIDYDCDAFFNKTMKHHTPESTIAQGLAVCGGYAAVYLAIALEAGLECVMVTGHGKGYGYDKPKDGESIPPENATGHAWNAVRIDGGEWKLLDACWGAGHVGDMKYTRCFDARHFISTNEVFGETHFPDDKNYFFRADGRTPSWAEYIIGNAVVEPPETYDSSKSGLSKTSFLPASKNISIRAGGMTRFQFSKMCPHWDFVKNGPAIPYCMVLHVRGVDGREDDYVPFDTDGSNWWLDIETRKLGCAAQKVTILTVTSVNGNENIRGMSKREYLTKKGKCGMGFGVIAYWDLV
jgi:hypothetical protein